MIYVPKLFYRRPVLLLDSGQSVAESVFLEHFRQRLIEDMRYRESRPTIWLLYPDRHLWARHGCLKATDYDRYEVRPIRLEKPPRPEGIFASLATYEDGCAWNGRVPTWRKWHDKAFRRAAVVYLNPTPREWDWLEAKENFWHVRRRVPYLHVGAPFGRTIRRSAARLAAGFWIFDLDAWSNLAKVFGRHRVNGFHFDQWWPREPPQHQFTAAPDWRDAGSQRYPDFAAAVARDQGWEAHMPANRGIWQEVMSATSSRYYCVATRAESSPPFDAAMALSRGSCLLAPDLPSYRALQGDKILWPARIGYDNQTAQWNFHDIRPWLMNKLREREATCPSSSRQSRPA